MSVIPFILADAGRTVVESRQDFDNAGGISGKVIYIQNLDRDQIVNTDSSNASYDLRVGTQFCTQFVSQQWLSEDGSSPEVRRLWSEYTKELV